MEAGGGFTTLSCAVSLGLLSRHCCGPQASPSFPFIDAVPLSCESLNASVSQLCCGETFETATIDLSSLLVPPPSPPPLSPLPQLLDFGDSDDLLLNSVLNESSPSVMMEVSFPTMVPALAHMYPEETEYSGVVQVTSSARRLSERVPDAMDALFDRADLNRTSFFTLGECLWWKFLFRTEAIHPWRSSTLQKVPNLCRIRRRALRFSVRFFT